MSSAAALAAAVRVEHEVVYGYGVVGAHLGGSRRRFAAMRLAAHQSLRDRLQTLGRIGMAGRPAYRLPFPVEDEASATALAIRLEDGAAAALYAVVAASVADGGTRTLSVDMLSDVATAAARWRTLSAVTNDPAFPGQPMPASPASQASTTSTTAPSSSTAASGSTS